MLLKEVKEMIIDKYDPDDVIEALEISTEDLLDAFENKLSDNLVKFEEDEAQ